MILYHISGITRNMMIFIIMSLEQRFSFLGTYCYTDQSTKSVFPWIFPNFRMAL